MSTAIRKAGYVYILTTASNTVLYIGVTSDLPTRTFKHKNKFYPDAFTARYNCSKLVYWQEYSTITDAIAAEKKLKSGNRKIKEHLINSMNPDWQDLANDFMQYE